MKAKTTAIALVRALIVAALAMIFLGIHNAEAETMVCTVTKGQYVNVRTGATSSASSLGRKIHNGDEVEILGIANGWITIDWNGVNAYVQSKYFEAVIGREYTVIANGRVRWRKTPGGDVGGYYQPGDVVTVDAYTYGTDGGMWGRIGERYVSMDFLEPYETEDEKEFYAKEDY